MKSVPRQILRIGWFKAKKGRVDVRALYPAGSSRSRTSGMSHYDDDEARFGTETYWAGRGDCKPGSTLPRSKGKKFWRSASGASAGPATRPLPYIQSMHDVLERKHRPNAHEAYFNSGSYQLYPIKSLPKSSSEYQKKF